MKHVSGGRSARWRGGKLADSTRAVVLAALASCAAVAVSSGQGYEFSISASDTDPFVNTSAPTDSARALYFWATCVEGGLSAFEGDVTGSLSPLGFTPDSTVVNAGNSTSLLLGIAGCPVGATVNHLLGHWTVWDSGGTFCLGPSDANGWIGAVDCDPLEARLTQDPLVVGFSSLSGTDPCEGGTNGCVGEGFDLGESGWGSIGSEY